MLIRAAISLSSKFKSIVRLSSYEAEYVAMCDVKTEALWLSYLLAEVRFGKRSSPVTMFANNQEYIALSNNPEFHRRIKLIDV